MWNGFIVVVPLDLVVVVVVVLQGLSVCLGQDIQDISCSTVKWSSLSLFIHPTLTR